MLSLCGCSGGEEVVVSYEEGDETLRADMLFEEGSTAELKLLCKTMSGNNDDPETRDNFFYYILIKIASIAENEEEDKYETALEVMDTCLKLPLTQAVVSDGLKQCYRIIDGKLTEKTKEYLIGRWRRTDTTLMSGAVIEVIRSGDSLEAKIMGLPDDESLRFRIGDTKWTNIQFANHQKFFFSDLSTEEIDGIENYYKDEAAAVYVYSEAVANINFNNDTITVSYEKSDMTSGANQIWVKLGSGHEEAGYDELLAENEQQSAAEEAEDALVPEETIDETDVN